LVEVYPATTDQAAKELFTEINKAEPVTLSRYDREQAGSDRAPAYAFSCSGKRPPVSDNRPL
jgi:hypothetical protein